MKSNKIRPQFINKYNPRIGLIALATDFIIEKDFIKIIKDKDIDFFVNRIECYNPLSKENLIKMSEKVTDVTKNILPDENIDCVVYGCTSGTIAVGHDTIERKVKEAKPKAKITTPSTAAIKALKKLNIKKLAIFTPYSKKLNDEIIDYFSSQGFDIVANTYLDIAADYDIGKVDQNFLLETLSQIEIKNADALFISCTALPVLNIIERLEKKLGKPVITSNQSLIWDTLVQINKNNSIEGQKIKTDVQKFSINENKKLLNALLTITIADISMSIDNVLAVAAIAREDRTLLIFGLVLAIIFMAFFATIIMKILTKYKWVSWLGLIFLLYLSTEMVIDGFPGFYEIFRK